MNEVCMNEVSITGVIIGLVVILVLVVVIAGLIGILLVKASQYSSKNRKKEMTKQNFYYNPYHMPKTEQTCLYCNYPVKSDFQYCPKCGNILTKSSDIQNK